ncbi:hypothetical protein I0D00_20325 [Pseudomonas lalucatii]|uniref:SprA-related family protein n=1 Tax=Pseudomonas lalucatii TaxID=1424203 RepID=A0ABS5Q8K5_9PSED|nr:putative metalloprotease CJM1_0395 family protein [Pseudomonas lalucatii]MBS7664259.1 hypothetical protein [Pseudomonas lalucatii]MBS7690953.1 hypothetical protein [Pseudomonas lalucatii]MBS7725518.1 hypothetical protein [Pseudomonas lalucatii]QVM86543.1 hypothetical protein I0D68_11595 [Pseudomonas lalucatii]
MQIGGPSPYPLQGLALRAAAPFSSAERSEQSAAPAEPAERGAGQQPQQQQQIAELSSRDREVRAHEQAHAAVGGPYAGAPSNSYSRGPDGRRYVTAGTVAIDVGPVAGDPAATLHKMEVVLRAALAPAEPSAEDRRVAAQAQGQMVQARIELAERQRDQRARPATALQSNGQAEHGSGPGQLLDLRA